MFGLIQTTVQPDSVIMAANPFVWIDPRYIASGTIATAFDRSSNSRHFYQSNAAFQPLLEFSGSLPVMSFDGVDNFMSSASFNLTSTNALTIFIAHQQPVAATAILLELSVNAGANAGAFYCARGETTAGDISSKIRGNVEQGTRRTNAAQGTDNLNAAFVLDFSQSSANEVKLYKNNAEPAATNLAVAENTANFGNYTLYLGSRAGTSVFFSGRISQLILFSSSISSRSAVDSAIRDITGIL